MRLPAEAPRMHMPRSGTWRYGDPETGPSFGPGVGGQSPGAERAAARVAARRMMARKGTAGSIRGRTAIAMGLAAFLVVTTSVVWRRAEGSAAAIRLHSLGSRIDELESQRARLDGEVRRASSRQELAPRAQRLGMRFPSDSQIIDLPDPVRR